MNLPENNNLAHDNSEYCEEWLSAYIDDELTETQRALVDQRLSNDGDARQMLADLQSVRGLVNQLSGWSGKLASPVEAMQERQSTGDYHDELQPTPGDSLHSEVSESISGTLAQDWNPTDFQGDATQVMASAALPMGNTARSAQSSHVTWLRPLALAAGLLGMVGGGAWLWNSGPLWMTVKSTGVSQAAQDGIALKSATSEMQPSSLEETLDFSGASPAPAAAPVPFDALIRQQTPQLTDRLAENSAAAVPGLGRDSMNRGLPPPVAKEKLSESGALAAREAAEEQPQALGSQRSDAIGSLAVELEAAKDAGSYKAHAPAEDAPQAPATRELNEASSRLAPQMRKSAVQTQVQVQVAHSVGWTAAEIETAVQRLAPLLNLPSSSPTAPSIASSAAAIPVAVISQKPLIGQGLSLHDRLQQQPIALQEVVAADAQPFAWQAPLGPTAADNPSTVALFVLRDEAEQILQAVQPPSELPAKPVWITSAAGTPTPASPKQQVVLLFAPQ